MRDLGRLAGGEAGRLFMAIECHSCFEWLLPAINAYREAWPDVELDIAGGFNFDPLPALGRGDLDLVVTADPIDNPDLAYLPLFSYEAQVAVAADHPLAGKEWLDAEDLAEETLIVYPVDRRRLDVFTRFLDPAGVQPANVRTAELTTMMVQLVASGSRRMLSAELGLGRIRQERLRGGAFARRGRRVAESGGGYSSRAARCAFSIRVCGPGQEDLLRNLDRHCAGRRRHGVAAARIASRPHGSRRNGCFRR